MQKSFLERDKKPKNYASLGSSQGRSLLKVAKTSLRICFGWMMWRLTIGSGFWYDWSQLRGVMPPLADKVKSSVLFIKDLVFVPLRRWVRRLKTTRNASSRPYTITPLSARSRGASNEVIRLMIDWYQPQREQEINVCRQAQQREPTFGLEGPVYGLAKRERYLTESRDFEIGLNERAVVRPCKWRWSRTHLTEVIKEHIPRYSLCLRPKTNLIRFKGRIRNTIKYAFQWCGTQVRPLCLQHVHKLAAGWTEYRSGTCFQIWFIRRSPVPSATSSNIRPWFWTCAKQTRQSRSASHWRTLKVRSDD